MSNVLINSMMNAPFYSSFSSFFSHSVLFAGKLYSFCHQIPSCLQHLICKIKYLFSSILKKNQEQESASSLIRPHPVLLINHENKNGVEFLSDQLKLSSFLKSILDPDLVRIYNLQEQEQNFADFKILTAPFQLVWDLKELNEVFFKIENFSLVPFDSNKNEANKESTNEELNFITLTYQGSVCEGELDGKGFFKISDAQENHYILLNGWFEKNQLIKEASYYPIHHLKDKIKVSSKITSISDDFLYEGDLVNHQPDGMGLLVHQAPQLIKLMQIGKFEKGKLVKGVSYQNSNRIFKGAFNLVDGSFLGEIFQLNPPSYYNGSAKNSQYEGQGKLVKKTPADTQPNGTLTYEGNFHLNVFNRGKITFKSEEIESTTLLDEGKLKTVMCILLTSIPSEKLQIFNPN